MSRSSKLPPPDYTRKHVGGIAAVRQRALNATKRDWRPKFLEAFSVTGIITDAARAAEISWRTVYRERDRNEEFAKDFAEAEQKAIGVLERAALARAVQGVAEPIYQKGELVGERRVYSDQLLMFLLRARDRNRFGDRLTVKEEPSDVSIDEEVRRLAQELKETGRLEAQRLVE